MKSSEIKEIFLNEGAETASEIIENKWIESIDTKAPFIIFVFCIGFLIGSLMMFYFTK